MRRFVPIAIVTIVLVTGGSPANAEAAAWGLVRETGGEALLMRISTGDRVTGCAPLRRDRVFRIAAAT